MFFESTGNGNADSAEVQSSSQAKQARPQRVNYPTNYQHQTIYSPPRNKFSTTLANEPIKDAGKKYGIYGANIYHNNLGNNNNFNHSSSQYSDEYPYVTLNDFMRTRQFNRNYVHHHTTGANLNLNNGSNLWWFSAQNLGLRLIASTVCTFLILALLFFLIHRLRQRRWLVMIRSK